AVIPRVGPLQTRIDLRVSTWNRARIRDQRASGNDRSERRRELAEIDLAACGQIHTAALTLGDVVAVQIPPGQRLAEQRNRIVGVGEAGGPHLLIAVRAEL